MAEKALRYLVSGRVQGVFYRASTAETARNLNLNGWARNLRDGRVEVVARGDEAALAKLARWLWDGPPSARVDRVSMTEWPDDVPVGFKTL
jgi:acylphosphatase